MDADLRQRITDLDAATLSALTGGEAIVLDHVDKGTQKITLSDIKTYFGLDKYDVLVREIFAPFGDYGIEWDLDELMGEVGDGNWMNFATGDYVITENTDGEKAKRLVAGKNQYYNCGSTRLAVNHIVVEPKDCMETLYAYNSTATNSGGYAASLMPSNLEAEYEKLPNELKKYVTYVSRLENNKSAWAWASRRIFLPTNVELVGHKGWADQYGSGATTQLPLHVGGTAHTLKGRGYNKKTETRRWYWTADPVEASTTNFCSLTSYGDSSITSASNTAAVAPLLVLSK